MMICWFRSKSAVPFPRHFFLVCCLLAACLRLSAQTEVTVSEVEADDTPVFSLDGVQFDFGPSFLSLPPFLSPLTQWPLPGSSPLEVTLPSWHPNTLAGIHTGAPSWMRLGMSLFPSELTSVQGMTFRLNNGIRLSTFGDYDLQGHKRSSPGVLPWQRNNFHAAFEMKSPDGRFGFRVEMRQGRYTPF